MPKISSRRNQSQQNLGESYLTASLVKVLHYKEDSKWGLFLFRLEAFDNNGSQDMQFESLDDMRVEFCGDKHPVHEPEKCLVKVTGVIHNLMLGSSYALHGVLQNDPKWGKQFKLKSATIHVDVKDGDLAKNFMEGFFDTGKRKGQGKRFLTKLIAGIPTAKLAERIKSKNWNHPEFSEGDAQELCDAWNHFLANADVIKWMNDMDLSQYAQNNILEMWGTDARRIIEDNPYDLVDVPGIGFKIADDLALNKLGIREWDRFRQIAGGMEVLKKTELNGNTWMKLEHFCNHVKGLLKLKILEDDLHESRKFTVDDGRIFLRTTYMQEKMIAEKLSSIIHENSVVETPEDAVLEEVTKDLNTEQKKVIDFVFEHQAFLLTGGPGTGKTHVTRKICDLLQNQTVVLLAPTGKAAKRMAQLTGREAHTIHKFFKVSHQNPSGSFRWPENPAPGNVFIVDEVSMVNTHLLSILMRAISKYSKVIFIGDADQLPAIGAGNTINDLTKLVPVVRLQEVMRTGEGSLITKNAQKVNRADPYMEESEGEFEIVTEDQAQSMRGIIRKKAKEMQRKNMDLQILVPMRKTKHVGLNDLNAILQADLNPQGRRISGKFRVGDKVICIKNTYDHTRPLMNGDMGRIVDAGKMKIEEYIQEYGSSKYVHAGSSSGDGEVEILKVFFDDQEEPDCIPKAMIGNFELAFAISIHKSQGSEFEHVLVAIHKSNWIMLQRNLLYTAITRGKKSVLVVTDTHSVVVSCNTAMQPRKTGLVQAVKAEEEKAKEK